MVGKGNTLLYHERSDVGRKRSNNQDSAAVMTAQSPAEYRNRGWLLAVADGMGAHLGGEEASRIAATRVPELYAESGPQRSPPLALRKSLQQVNREIHRKGERDPAFRGMGTTCSVLVLLPRGALIGHVGDSRIYRIRSGRIEQLSRDHSLAWEIAAAAGPAGEEGSAAVPKNIITRSMGPHDEVEIDLEGPFPIELGDTFVLCSDGLSGSLRDEEIALLVTELPPEEATAALVGLALIRGAPDNTTVIVATAGPEEVSRYSRRDAAWPLEDDGGSAAARNRPWIFLGIAATCLFIALLINPSSDLVKDGSPLIQSLSQIGSLACVGLALGCLAGSFFGFMMPPAKRVRAVAPGKQLGKGPYRSYDATPNSEQFAGILNSLEAAAGEIGPAGQAAADRLRAVTSRCRELVAAADFPAATRQAAEGFAIFTTFIESGRGEDTVAESTSSEAS
jgi:serine/threonine protein phosphatase PrpC